MVAVWEFHVDVELGHLGVSFFVGWFKGKQKETTHFGGTPIVRQAHMDLLPVKLGIPIRRTRIEVCLPRFSGSISASGLLCTGFLDD